MPIEIPNSLISLAIVSIQHFSLCSWFRFFFFVLFYSPLCWHLRGSDSFQTQIHNFFLNKIFVAVHTRTHTACGDFECGFGHGFQGSLAPKSRWTHTHIHSQSRTKLQREEFTCLFSTFFSFRSFYLVTRNSGRQKSYFETWLITRFAHCTQSSLIVLLVFTIRSHSIQLAMEFGARVHIEIILLSCHSFIQNKLVADFHSSQPTLEHTLAVCRMSVCERAEQRTYSIHSKRENLRGTRAPTFIQLPTCNTIKSSCDGEYDEHRTLARALSFVSVTCWLHFEILLNGMAWNNN